MKRIVTAREQAEMLSPWHITAGDKFSETPYWFHASPYELAPGTILTPRGGKTTWNRLYNKLNPQESQEIQNHVWLDNNINVSRNRAYGRGHYIYRVEPNTEPKELGLAGGGHCTDSARIVELIGKTPKRQRRTSAKPRRFNQEWQVIGGDYMPLDVISHYMDRKGEGFGDEKSLYEMNGEPPLSQQVKNNGYEKPVGLYTDGRSGSVYDGHHRIDVARQLGYTHVPVQVSWRVPDPVWGANGAYGNKIEPWLKGWLTDMRRGRETTGALHIRADMSDQPDDVTDDYTLAEFFQWCAHNRYKPNQVSLDQYAEVSGMDLQDYQDLSNFLDGMGLEGDGFLDKTSTTRTASRHQASTDWKQESYGISSGMTVFNRNASQRFWAMADTTKWHPMIKQDRGGWWGNYSIRIPSKTDPLGQKVGELSYSDRAREPLHVDSIFVHPEHRNKGIGQALIERLAQDFPDRQIDPGETTPEGNGFTERLRSAIPEAKERIIPDYNPQILDDDEDVEYFNKEQLERLVSARFWKSK